MFVHSTINMFFKSVTCSSFKGFQTGVLVSTAALCRFFTNNSTGFSIGLQLLTFFNSALISAHLTLAAICSKVQLYISNSGFHSNSRYTFSLCYHLCPSNNSPDILLLLSLRVKPLFLSDFLCQKIIISKQYGRPIILLMVFLCINFSFV